MEVVMAYENIIYEVQEGIAKITFNRPKALNALNAALLEEFSSALDDIAADENIRVLVLTGAGDKSFVAGADITELATFTSLTAKNFSQKGHAIIAKLQQLPIAVIAAVNGFALGGGTEIAIACDFIYASDNAKFGQPEINLGLIPGFGGTQRLPRLIGANFAKELVFTGKMIAAAEAEKIGLVNKVVPQDQLMEEVVKTAREIASKGKASLREAKQAINNGLNTDLATGIHIEVESFGMCYASSDSKEGTSAFLEKRKPDFKGSLKD
jgi:enoyl-CoA hydratase